LRVAQQPGCLLHELTGAVGERGHHLAVASGREIRLDLGDEVFAGPPERAARARAAGMAVGPVISRYQAGLSIRSPF